MLFLSFEACPEVRVLLAERTFANALCVLCVLEKEKFERAHSHVPYEVFLIKPRNVPVASKDRLFSVRVVMLGCQLWEVTVT